MTTRLHLCTLLILLLAAAVLRAQTAEQPAANTAGTTGSGSRASVGGIIGLEWLNSQAINGRFYVGLAIGDYLDLSPLTVATQRSPADNTFRLSINGLSLIPLLLSMQSINGGDGWGYLALLALPQIISNPTFNLGIIDRVLIAQLAQRTDFYLFSDGARIYTETSLGLKLGLGKFSAAARYTWPLTQGYLESRASSISIGLYYGGN